MSESTELLKEAVEMIKELEDAYVSHGGAKVLRKKIKKYIAKIENPCPHGVNEERCYCGEKNKTKTYEIEIDKRAVLVVVKQYDESGEEVVIQNIVPAENFQVQFKSAPRD